MRKEKKLIFFSKMKQIKRKIQGLCHLIILEETIRALIVILRAIIEEKPQLLLRLMGYNAIKEIIIKMKN